MGKVNVLLILMLKMGCECLASFPYHVTMFVEAEFTISHELRRKKNH